MGVRRRRGPPTPAFPSPSGKSQPAQVCLNVLYLRRIEGLRGILSFRSLASAAHPARVCRLVPGARRRRPPARIWPGRLRPLQAALRARLSRADTLAQLIRDVHTFIGTPARCRGDRRPWGRVVTRSRLARDRRRRRRPGAGGRSRREGSLRFRSRTRSPSACGSSARGNRALRGISRAIRGFRMATAAAAAIAFPLVCRGRTIGALVGIDKATSTREPRLTPATSRALHAALEPAAFALDNALRVERAEALSVTDDLRSCTTRAIWRRCCAAKRSARAGAAARCRCCFSTSTDSSPSTTRTAICLAAARSSKPAP